MDNGYLLVSPVHTGKMGSLYVPTRLADNINKGIVIKLDENTQFKIGDLISFHKTEGEKFGENILLHEKETFGYERA